MCFWAVHVRNFRVFERRLRRARGTSLAGVNRAYRFASYSESLVIFIDMFGWTDLKLGSNWLVSRYSNISLSLSVSQRRFGALLFLKRFLMNGSLVQP